MKPNFLFSVTAALGCLFTVLNPVHAQIGTAFTYQGRLTDNNAAANGLYSLRFRLIQVNNGAPQGPVLTNNAIAVSNGLFTTTLDFGSYFGTREFGLEIGVRTNGSSVPVIVPSPNNPTRPTPMAMVASHALLSDSVLSVPDSALSANVPRLDAPALWT